MAFYRFASVSLSGSQDTIWSKQLIDKTGNKKRRFLSLFTIVFPLQASENYSSEEMCDRSSGCIFLSELIIKIFFNLQIETFPATHSSLTLNTSFLVDEVTATQDKNK